MDRQKELRTMEEAETLLHSDSTPSFERPARSRFCRYRQFVIVLKDLILLTLAIPTVVVLLPHVLHIAPPNIYEEGTASHIPLPGCNCGNSIAQALELNCTYDSLAAAWLPPHCRDTELSAMFERAGDGPNGSWVYWADKNHTQEITVKQVAALADVPDGRFYMTHNWHLVHCTFYWRKMIRSKALGVTIEPRYDVERHAVHCGKMFGYDGTRGAMSGVALNSNI